MLIISLKLPAARITLKNISDSENLISLHLEFSLFLCFQFPVPYIHATLSASLQLWRKRKGATKYYDLRKEILRTF